MPLVRDERGRLAGGHWREPQPFWDREWLYREYVIWGRSAAEIAEQFECKENNILYWLHKHNIPVRDISEARRRKRWRACGKDNPMFNRRGEINPNWRGGVTPERQEFYMSRRWKTACRIVWSRDKATCQRCGHKASEDVSLHIHHITSFSVKELRSVTDNLVLLCKACHDYVHSKKNIDGEWIGSRASGGGENSGG